MFAITTVAFDYEREVMDAYCWGFFPLFEIAEGVLYRDGSEMHQYFYPYLVIESIPLDRFNPQPRECAWYAFEKERMIWKETMRPKELEYFKNFAIRR